MVDFYEQESDPRSFYLRLAVLAGLVLVCFFCLLIRFIWLQVFLHNNYATLAEKNRISFRPLVPNRGLIMDRNGVILAKNYLAYALEVTPSEISGNIDEVIDELSKLVTIDPIDRRRFRESIKVANRFEGVLLRSQLTDEEVARFVVHRYRFPGVDIQPRFFRQYPLGKVASHVIGYIGRMSPKDVESLKDEDEANYRGTRHMGKDGVEKTHEKELHGITGYEEVEVSAGGRPIRTLSSNAATPGKNIYLSIDIELQKIIEAAFGERRGAVVAIQPETGEVLAYVSAPTYDPNLFVDGIDHHNWNELNNSPDKPLINRPIRGAYPPGSTYKPFMSLMALELGKRTPEFQIADPGFFNFGNHRFRDDKVGGHGYVDMYRSIVHSCDTYYYILASEMHVDEIHAFMQQFGFGQLTGIDLAHERKGLLPSTEWKRKAFKTPAQQKWYPGENISLGIGQGYNSFTLMQLAYATAILANNGRTRRPHLVHEIEDAITKEKVVIQTEERVVDIKQEHFDIVKHAMLGVTKEGTATRVFAGAGYESGGKTGTAQVIGIKQGEKYVASRIAERHRDHALYIAFAPYEKPTIALAVIVENGGFGASAAAPIARKALDYYLLGKRSTQEKVYIPETEEASSSEQEENDITVPTEGRLEELTPVQTDVSSDEHDNTGDGKKDGDT